MFISTNLSLFTKMNEKLKNNEEKVKFLSGLSKEEVNAVRVAFDQLKENQKIDNKNEKFHTLYILSVIDKLEQIDKFKIDTSFDEQTEINKNQQKRKLTNISKIFNDALVFLKLKNKNTDPKEIVDQLKDLNELMIEINIVNKIVPEKIENLKKLESEYENNCIKQNELNSIIQDLNETKNDLFKVHSEQAKFKQIFQDYRKEVKTTESLEKYIDFLEGNIEKENFTEEEKHKFILMINNIILYNKSKLEKVTNNCKISLVLLEKLRNEIKILTKKQERFSKLQINHYKNINNIKTDLPLPSNLKLYSILSKLHYAENHEIFDKLTENELRTLLQVLQHLQTSEYHPFDENQLETIIEKLDREYATISLQNKEREKPKYQDIQEILPQLNLPEDKLFREEKLETTVERLFSERAKKLLQEKKNIKNSNIRKKAVSFLNKTLVAFHLRTNPQKILDQLEKINQFVLEIPRINDRIFEIEDLSEKLQKFKGKMENNLRILNKVLKKEKLNDNEIKAIEKDMKVDINNELLTFLHEYSNDINKLRPVSTIMTAQENYEQQLQECNELLSKTNELHKNENLNIKKAIIEKNFKRFNHL